MWLPEPALTIFEAQTDAIVKSADPATIFRVLSLFQRLLRASSPYFVDPFKQMSGQWKLAKSTKGAQNDVRTPYRAIDVKKCLPYENE